MVIFSSSWWDVGILIEEGLWLGTFDFLSGKKQAFVHLSTCAFVLLSWKPFLIEAFFFLTRRDLRLADQEPTEAVGFSADSDFIIEALCFRRDRRLLSKI